MNRSEKEQAVKDCVSLLDGSPHLYLINMEGLDSDKTYKLRKLCHEQSITLKMVKNTLLKLALQDSQKEGLEPLLDTLRGNTAIMLSEIGNAPAKLITSYIKSAGSDMPELKGAYVEEGVYVGKDQLAVLAALKSKEEVIADVIALLQSPVKNVVSSLQSAPNKLSGLVEALSKQ